MNLTLDGHDEASEGAEHDARALLDALRSRGILNFDDLQQLASVTQEYLVDGLLPEKSISILVGDSGLGKTPLALALAIAVASGTSFLDRKVAL
jgi:RecA-family ATPase